MIVIIIIIYALQLNEGGRDTLVRIFGREIFLIAVQEHDAGKYTCVAENEAGSASATIMVDTGCEYYQISFKSFCNF